MRVRQIEFSRGHRSPAATRAGIRPACLDGVILVKILAKHLPLYRAERRNSAAAFFHLFNATKPPMLEINDITVTATEASRVALRDEDGAIRSDYVGRVVAAIGAADVKTLHDLVGAVHEADVGALLERLEPEDRTKLIELMGPDFDFTALVEVDDTVREEILEELPAETVAEGVRELDSDDAVYILEDLPSDERAEILEQLPSIERVALARSFDYPEGSAGRRMQTEFIAVQPDWTVGHTIDYLRATEELPDRFYEIYVVGPAQQLLGAVALDQLLRTKRPVPVAELMNPDHRKVGAGEDQNEVARMFERYNLVAAPVVDTRDRLVGVLTVDDIVDVIEEKADEEIKALGGVGDEELSDSVWIIARSRFNWLLVNLATAFLASSVLGLFEGQLQKMVALAVLAPIVASQGGNAATQTMTVAVRALATRDLGHANARRIVMREMMVGILNGLAFAVITGVVASFWFKLPDLGVVIGLAMMCNLFAAALGGILIPLALDRFRADPAVSSGVFVTTVTDVVGFFSFLGIATLWFGLR
jgi:magnesium transporter